MIVLLIVSSLRLTVRLDAHQTPRSGDDEMSAEAAQRSQRRPSEPAPADAISYPSDIVADKALMFGKAMPLRC
jgi:hypothetical protein